MGRIRRLVLDTMKPHEPGIVELARRLSDLPGVGSVNVSIVEVDQRVENAKITVEGEHIRYDAVEAVIVDLGGAIHSVDEVVAGASIIDDAQTPQD